MLILDPEKATLKAVEGPNVLFLPPEITLCRFPP
jgi:hypothetical protein